jgi:hypothetical protein
MHPHGLAGSGGFRHIYRVALTCDDSVGDEVRLCPAAQLASLDPSADAQAFRGISDDRSWRRRPLEAASTLMPPPTPSPPRPPRPPR